MSIRLNEILCRSNNKKSSMSSIVQIAFGPNEDPVHCGYCNTDGSCSAGLY